MNSFDFDRPIDRNGTSSQKWDRYAGRDVLPLWVADMDFQAPPAVMSALHQRVDHGVFGYTNPPDSLAAAVRQRLQADYGWEIDPRWLVWLPGLVTGLNVACRSAGEDGDEVLTAVPVYPPFLSAPGYSRRRLATVPLQCSDGRWTFDFERLEAAITPRTRLFILCNPHNPVGRVFDRAELETLAAICRRHEVTICSDEIHCDLLLEPGVRHIPLAALDPETAARTITLMAPSKTYNIPGLGCSFAVIPNDRLRRRFVQARVGIVPDVNIMGYVAAEAALRDDRRWIEALRTYLRGNRDLLTQRIAALPGISMSPVEATYLAWIDARGTGWQRPVEVFEQAGVGLSDGRDFGGDGFVRFNFGCTRATLTTALQRMERALAAGGARAGRTDGA